MGVCCTRVTHFSKLKMRCSNLETLNQETGNFGFVASPKKMSSGSSLTGKNSLARKEDEAQMNGTSGIRHPFQGHSTFLQKTVPSKVFGLMACALRRFPATYCLQQF